MKSATFQEKKQSTSSKLLSLFQLCDKNGDGLLDRDEFEVIMKALGSLSPNSFDDGQARAVLAAFDVNGDGFINYTEFVQWVMADAWDRVPSPTSPGKLRTTHVFLRPMDEARLECETLFSLRKDQNTTIMKEIGFCSLDDPSLLVLSMGSSSTQVYDAGGFAASLPIGTSVYTEAALERLKDLLTESRSYYRRVLFINSIGYSLTEKDPCLLDMEALVDRLPEKASDDKANTTKISAAGLLRALRQALGSSADIRVHNRAKDSETKRSKFQQLANDFSEALACGRALNHAAAYDAIVDWGGKSYKVYANGRRIGTEVMDANALLCVNGQLDHVQLKEAIRDIEAFVLTHLPKAKKILIAQTGKARELAMKEENFGKYDEYVRDHVHLEGGRGHEPKAEERTVKPVA